MDGVSVYPIGQANEKDTRGETWTWVQNHPVSMVVCRRKKGPISCHVHKGEDAGGDPSKSPERLFVASGTVRFTFYSPYTGKKEEVDVKAGTVVSIDPNIVHKTETISDDVAVILESRITPFDPKNPDTYAAEIP